MTSSAVTTIPKVDYTTTPHPSGVKALSLKDAPALIESLLPVQKLSVDVFKERSAVHGQTLTALGSYWKGRKPLVLNRACVLASLLPASDDPIKDLEVFELLMGMDDVSMSKRLGLAKPEEIVRIAKIEDINAHFVVEPQEDALPQSAPFDVKDYKYVKNGKELIPKLKWRTDISETKRHEVAALTFEYDTYRDLATDAKRAEEVADELSTHIWGRVNQHLGTNAVSFPELVEQLGVMRFGHRPTVADTFSGSGQIPFAAAQLGCDVYASDLNPVACMLTWGAFKIVGASAECRAVIEDAQVDLVARVKAEIDSLGIEQDGNGWRGKVYLYCLEVTCPSSGWKVPVLPTLVVSKGKSVYAKLVPVPSQKCYDIELVCNASAAEMKAAEQGTYRKGDVVHVVNGVEHVNSIASIRGDYTSEVDGKRVKRNRLRHWDKADVVFRVDDIFNERLYAIQWIKELPEGESGRAPTEFRTVTQADLAREKRVTEYVQAHLAGWQEKGWVPDTRIEPGDETERLYRERGWTHWHHLFNPRQLLLAALWNSSPEGHTKFILTQLLNWNARLSLWSVHDGGGGAVKNVFMNQALNTTMNYGCRGFEYAKNLFELNVKTLPEVGAVNAVVMSHTAEDISLPVDVFVTDPLNP